MSNTFLPLDWAFRPALDAELKQYLLYGYLQRVRASFAASKLYPHLDELDLHMQELVRVKQQKRQLARALGGELTGFDPTTGNAIHEAPAQDNWLDVVDNVIDMAMPALQIARAEGHGLRDQIARSIQFGPVGLLPLNAQAGWLLLRDGREARAYSFELVVVHRSFPDDVLQRVRTRYCTTFTMGIVNTFERIKSELISGHRELPNPAVFAFECDRSIPPIETYMPLAKQLVYEVVAKRA